MIEGVIRKRIGVANHTAACRRIRRVAVDHQRTILHDDCDWYCRTDCRPPYRKSCESIRRRYRKGTADSFQGRGWVAAINKSRLQNLLICRCIGVVVRNHNCRNGITSKYPYCQGRRALVTVGIRYRINEGVDQTLVCHKSMYSRIIVVERVGIGTVSPNHHAAIASQNRFGYMSNYRSAGITARSYARYRNNRIIVGPYRIIFTCGTVSVDHIARCNQLGIFCNGILIRARSRQIINNTNIKNIC